MPGSFQVKIITPEDVFFTGEVSSLVAPGAEGYLGILKDHAPLVTPLIKGVLTLKSGDEKKYNIDGGFLEVSANRVTILVEKISKTAENSSHQS